MAATNQREEPTTINRLQNILQGGHRSEDGMPREAAACDHPNHGEAKTWRAGLAVHLERHPGELGHGDVCVSMPPTDGLIRVDECRTSFFYSPSIFSSLCAL